MRTMNFFAKALRNSVLADLEIAFLHVRRFSLVAATLLVCFLSTPALSATVVIDWGRNNPTGTDSNGVVWNDLTESFGDSQNTGTKLTDVDDTGGNATTIDFVAVAYNAGGFGTSNQSFRLGE